MFDGQHRWVNNCFPQKRQNAVKALKWLMNRHIALLEALKKGLPWRQLHRETSVVRGKQQLGVVDQIHNLRQTNQVDGTLHAVKRKVRQIELLEQKT